MNKMHTLAKIIITILAVYGLITFGIGILTTPFLTLWGGFNFTFILIILMHLIAIAATCLILRKTDTIANKIVGKQELPSPETQIEWIPVTYRLISVYAGLFCFYKATFYLSSLLKRFALSKAHNNNGLAYYSQFDYWPIPTLIILLIAGIYLVCGAPHFVRWQVKRTLEMCQKIETDKNTLAE